VAGGIAAAAIAIFFLFGSGNLRPQTPSGGQNSPPELQDLQLSIANVTAKKTNDKAASLQVAFNVFNPNRNTAILETVHYTVYIQDLKMTSGDIGSTPEGFLASQEGIYPAVSNTTLALKDTQVATRNNLTASAWDSMVAGEAKYRIEGTYLYKLTATSFQFSTGEKEFSYTFPPE
jgi:LEA14-like dessication related protein